MTTVSITISETDIDALSRLVEAEALSIVTYYQNEGYTIDQARRLAYAGIIDVVINRVAADAWYGDDLQDVINKPFQFTPVTGVGGDWANLPAADSATEDFVSNYVKERAEGAPSSVGNATHYYNPTISNPGWGSTMDEKHLSGDPDYTPMGTPKEIHIFGHPPSDAAPTPYDLEYDGSSTEFDTTSNNSVGSSIITAQAIFQQAEAAVVGGVDPIILDLDGDGIELTSREDSNVYFDISETEFNNIVGWSTGGDGMLAYDADNDGTIDDITELIGGNTAGGGFVALQENYDTNSDGIINSSDTTYSKLRVWIDSDEDGHTDSGELHSLSSLSITSLNLNAIDVNYQIAGNNITQESTFVIGGQTRQMVDAWFNFDTVNTVYGGSAATDMRTMLLPEQRGYGELANLSIAMSLDEDLLDMVEEVASQNMEDLFDPGFDLHDKMRDILMEWAGVDGVTPTALTSGLDAQQLAFVEKAMGQTYSGGWAGHTFLLQSWNLILGTFSANILGQAGMNESLGSPTYDVATDTLTGDHSEGVTVLRFGGAGVELENSGFNDVYNYAPGDGTSTVYETGDTDDTIAIHGVLPDDVYLWGDLTSVGSAYELEITYGSGDVVKVYIGSLATNGALVSNRVERVVFDDSTTWNLTSGLHIKNNNTGRILYATNFDDTIDGGTGNDAIYGYDGNDFIDGGAGSDQLMGGLGNDTYAFSAGDGTDTLNEDASAGTDTILIHGVLPANTYLWGDLTSVGSAYELRLTYGSGDMVKVYIGSLAANGALVSNRVESVVFDDSTTWNLTNGLHIRNDNTGRILYATNFDDTIDGGTGNDAIYGYDGNDFIDGGAGSDQLMGGLGNDTYAFSVGDGTDTLDEAASAGTDTILIHGVLPANTYLWGDLTSGGSSYELEITYGSGDVVKVHIGSLAGNGALVSNRVESVVFDDSTTWNLTNGLHIKNNNEARILYATNFNDVIDGGTANDVLYGYDGNDMLNGGTGSDQMFGSLGNDIYIVDNASDTLSESSNEGTDEVRSSIAYTLGNHIENLTLTGSTAINGTGNTLDNVLTGNSDNNTLTGGTGNDIYVIGQGGTDTITENASEGTDEVRSSVSHTLASNVENLVLTGSSNINATGNTLDNTLTGNSGNNVLDGVSGSDVMHGGLGDDTFYVNSGADYCYENASEGIDTISSTIGLNLSAGGAPWLQNIENLTLTGSTAINGTGNTLDNVLTGNSNNNTLTGGTGNDIYVVGQGGTDTITESASEGTDEVRSSTTATLAANVENLTLTGSSVINGTGNTLDNVLTGNSNNNTLAGGTGNDIYVIGQGGTDTITENASEGTDEIRTSVTFTIAANVENMLLTGSSHINGTGNSAANVITGNAGNNTLDGAGGADTLTGGVGNDIYVVDNAGDSATENASEGTDEVRAGVTWTLGSNVENLTLTGSSSIGGTGNALDNLLTGNSGDNTLTGGDGNDTLDGVTGSETMYGGLGDDIYYVNSGLDYCYENASEGTDTIISTISINLTAAAWLLNSENLTLTGASTINGTGNAHNNILTGNSSTNTLTGNDGDDTLYGGGGLDTLWGGANADTFVFEVASAFSNIDVIKDFSTAQADKIDIADLLTGYDPLTSAITDFLEITTSGANSVVKVDRDGTGGTYSLAQIATIEGVTGLTDEAALLTAGHILAA